jgi:hypothetical protein
LTAAPDDAAGGGTTAGYRGAPGADAGHAGRRPAAGVAGAGLFRARQGRSRGMVTGSRASTATSVAAKNTTEGVRTIESETTVTENSAAQRYMIRTLCR